VHWIIVYVQHWALREITTCSPQCGSLTFFPPFPANNVVVIVVSRAVILRRVFVVPSPHRPHSRLLSKGMADSLLLDACWVLFKNRFLLFFCFTHAHQTGILDAVKHPNMQMSHFTVVQNRPFRHFFRMIYNISAAFILTLPNGLLADWDPSSL
jgi:hypothetical protein